MPYSIQDHVKTSTPGVLQKLHMLQQQQRLCKVRCFAATAAEIP